MSDPTHPNKEAVAAEARERAIAICRDASRESAGSRMFGAPIDETWPPDALLGAIAILSKQLRASQAFGLNA